jgi:epoxide hydrolase-like predicted phosphatase
MIKAIVTDCFGVLYNDILKDMLARHGISDPTILKACFAAAQASDLGNITLDEFFDKLAQLTNIPLETIRTEMSDVSHLNLGFVGILKHLKPAFKIGMITDVGADLLAPFLANQQVKDLFDDIVISSEVSVTKPQAQIFEVMVERLGVEPSEIIFIDNSEINTQSAAELGMATILYTDNETLNASLHSLVPSTVIS